LSRFRKFAEEADWNNASLKFDHCPLDDPYLMDLAKHRNPGRTIKAIEYVRKRQGLPPLTDAETRDDKQFVETPGSKREIEPLSDIPSPFTFSLSQQGTIILASGKADWPVFPLQTSQRDHENRLETCRELATDLLLGARRQGFQARGEYAHGLDGYLSRLPDLPGKGNILLADAEARTLRNLFAAEADFLPVAFASKLKTFLEQHIGLRVFYPEIANFYRDVQRGHIEAPLPLDSVTAFVKGVKDNTPTIFHPSVTVAIEDSADSPPTIEPIKKEEYQSQNSDQPRPPRDPLGEVDPHKASEFTFAGTANNLWRAFLAGEKVHKAIDGWKKADDAIRPHAVQILDWLHRFMSSTDGTPPMPPTIGV